MGEHHREIIAFMKVLAPQLSYSPEREDGHSSRVEHALRAYERGLVSEHVDKYGRTYYRVPSASTPGLMHTVYLDLVDGLHSCSDCFDNVTWHACWHAIAAARYATDHLTAEWVRREAINEWDRVKAQGGIDEPRRRWPSLREHLTERKLAAEIDALVGGA